ncbi:MAG: hypothetical protein ACLQVG_25270 [Terriglobia bacterium]
MQEEILEERVGTLLESTAGMNGYIAEPIHAKEVFDAIAAVM